VVSEYNTLTIVTITARIQIRYQPNAVHGAFISMYVRCIFVHLDNLCDAKLSLSKLVGDT
jgi:hypothetical protein